MPSQDAMLPFDMPYTPQQLAEEESLHGKTPTNEELQQIIEGMECSLVLPTIKRSPQLLLCPVGLVGSGKTTAMKLLSPRLNLVRISSDEIRMRFRDKGRNNVRLLETAEVLIKKYLGEGYSVAIDADCAGTARELIETISRNSDVIPVWIHINPPESYILQKIETYLYTSTGLFKDAEIKRENYFRRKPLHEHLDLPFLSTLDPSKENYAQQIEETVKLIEEIH